MVFDLRSLVFDFYSRLNQAAQETKDQRPKTKDQSLRFTIYDSRKGGGEQEKKPCGLLITAHLLVQDRENDGRSR